MPSGTFRHASIGAAGQKPFECTVGWIAHYSIGVTLALVFVVLVSSEWLARPTLLPVLSYGLGTVVFPFFVLQPLLGLGVASSRAHNPTQARLKSLMTHSVFGVELYVSGLAVRYMVRWGGRPGAVDGLTQRCRYSEIHSTEDSCDSLRGSGSSSS